MTHKIQVYVNGILRGQNLGSYAPQGCYQGDGWTIGDAGGCSSTYPCFSGIIDEVEIFERALEAPEIRAIWAADSLGKCKPTCTCPHQGDLDGSGFIDVLKEIGIAFINGTDVQDPICPKTRGDVNNSGVVDVNDVLYIIKTAFTNGPAPVSPCGLSACSNRVTGGDVSRRPRFALSGSPNPRQSDRITHHSGWSGALVPIREIPILRATSVFPGSRPAANRR